MGDWQYQRGEISVGCIIGIIFLIVAILVAIKTVPVLTNIGEFQKTLEVQAERANIPGNTDAKIKAKILDTAESLDLPVEESQLSIRRTKSMITIHVEYDQEINYGVYTYSWRKVHDIERPLF